MVGIAMIILHGGKSIVQTVTSAFSGVSKGLGLSQEAPKAPTVKDNREAETKAKADAIRKARARERGRAGTQQSLLTGNNSGFNQINTKRKTLLGN